MSEAKAEAEGHVRIVQYGHVGMFEQSHPWVPGAVFIEHDWLEPLLRGIEASGCTSMSELAEFFERAEEVPFVSGDISRPGMVAGWCGHAVALSEWRAGFRNCERCGS